MTINSWKTQGNNEIIIYHGGTKMEQTYSEWIIKLQNKRGKTINRDKNAVQMYKYLIDNFDTDILSNHDYQITYRDFFRTQRGHNAQWHELYFQFIESLKKRYKDTKPLLSDYKNELENFYNSQLKVKLRTPKVETSFISKALHMLNHDLPIYDGNVLETLLHKSNRLVYQQKTVAAKLQKSEQLYKEINTAIQQVDKDALINEFRAAFGNDAIGISDVKIVDFYYWITK